MKLHRLRFGGLGPFREVHEVDFDEVSSSGLFLIEGATGSGKSTIIDAVVFALFGDVAGEESSKVRLVSQFLDTSITPPFAELTFTVHAGTFRVVRLAAHQRPKVRGQGFTAAKAEASIYRLSDDEISLPTNELRQAPEATDVSEVGSAVLRLLGLNRKQFTQTIVLPQGQFTTFLRAGAAEREELLQALFDTGLYKQVADRLKIKADAAQRDITAVESSLRDCLSVFGEAAQLEGEQRDELRDLQSDLPVLSQRVLGYVMQCVERAERLEDEAQQANTQAAQAVAAHESAATLANRVQRKIAAQAVAAELELRADEMQQVDARVVAIDRSALARERQRELTAALASEEGKRAAIGEALEAHPAQRGRSDSDVEVDAQALDQKVRGLEAARIAEGKLIALASEIAALDTSISDFAETAAKDSADIAVTVEALSEQLTSTIAEAEAAAATFHDLSRRLRASAAALLVGSLVDNQPCPVCGSCEHPNPVSGGDDHVDSDEVDAAQQAEVRAREAMEDARRALESTQQVQRALETLVSDDQVSTKKVGRILSQSEVTRLGEGVEARRSALAASTTRRDAAEADRAQANHEAEQGRADFSTVDERIHSLTSEATSLRKLAQAMRDHRAAVDLIDQAQQNLDDALAEAGLPDAAALVELSADAARRDGLADQVRAYGDQVAQVRATLNDLADIDSSVDVDVETPAAARRTAEETRDAAMAASAAARGTATQAQTRRVELEEKASELTKLRESSGPLVSLARLVTGHQGQNISLPLFAVQRRFREVVEVANQRLASMLGGRLMLEAHDEQTDLRVRPGLSLRVVDRDAGDVRDTSSLSGGESFCCSLALALGLAEVVAAEQGARRTEALFVDEGFGSLDADTLEDVTAELQRLRGEGRMVAVVSHVSEMKQQIPRQVRVRRVQGGYSRLEVV